MKPIHSGRVIAGKYRLEVCRARGGMGSVWQARHLLLDAPLAIKFIDPHLASSAEARGRFEREAKTVAQLRGAHVAQIHDYGIEDEIPYIAMELLAGEDLAARLARETRLPLSTSVNIVIQVAKVLRRAHAVGVIHRDLKPGNIFLVSGDEDEELVKVLDFGVAKTSLRLETHTDPTQSGTLVGSPRYMSPEQARGVRTVDHRTDLWALGVIAFRMVTGELPFPGNQIGDVILKICTQPAPVPSVLVPELPKEIDAFFARALSRDPDKRFQSAEEMARAFAAAAGQSPPHSSSDPISLDRAFVALATLDARSRASASKAIAEEPTRIPDPPAPVECTLPSSATHEAETTAPSPSERADSKSAHVLPRSEPMFALGARLRWSAAGAGIASLLLGAVLLLSRTAPVPAEAPATAASMPAAVPLVEIPSLESDDLAPVPTVSAAPSSSAEDTVSAAAPRPLVRPRAPSPRVSHPPARDRGNKPLGL